MKKVKVLFLSTDQSKQMEKSSYYLAEELKKQCEAMIHTEGGDIRTILSRLPDQPDYILLNDAFAPRLCPTIGELEKIDIPKGVIFHDLSNDRLERQKYVVTNKIGHIFSHYRDPFIRWYPRLAARMIWFPHHANTEIYKDYQQNKEIDLLMMGAVHPRLYPLRALMKAYYDDRDGFVYHPHPGHRHEDEIEQGSLIAEDYAREINRAKIFLTCDSVFNYPVMKYFEVLACNTLLLAPSSKELQDLGFVDGETFVAINKYNFHEKATYFLQNTEERIRIARNGYRMIQKNHSTQKRAGELIQHIERIISRS